MAVTVTVVFWNVMPCNLVACSNVFEDLTAPLFTIAHLTPC